MLDKQYILEVSALPVLSNPASFFQQFSSFPKNVKRNKNELIASVKYLLIYSYVKMTIDYVQIRAQIEMCMCCHSCL